MFKALIGIAGISTFLFVLEAIIFCKTKKLNKYVFVMHLGLEDVTQILIYSMVMKVNSDEAGFGSLLGVAQCVFFTVAKCVELFYGNMVQRTTRVDADPVSGVQLPVAHGQVPTWAPTGLPV